MVSSVSAGTPGADAETKPSHIDDVHNLVERIDILGVGDMDLGRPAGETVDINQHRSSALRRHERFVNEM